MGNFLGLGWINDSYNQWGSPGGWFVTSNAQKWTGSNSVPYGPTWLTGDVIGCGLDLVSGEIIFTKNGVRFPGKYTFDMVRRGPESGESFFPAVCISGYGSLEINFGERPLQSCLVGHYPLHYKLSSVQQEKLRKLFEYYKKLGQGGGSDDQCQGCTW
eukprot:TRINITY_DN4357_c0_g1_i8.p3 TRINITY_DN4357_c0_g1~~TRINITY_DN4357_c0_g1_i8.p3  ORF type:complete len:158 (+),score=40.49 TRINITY_DN4357_c0_g1_i8:3235-3708(+)